MYYKKQKYKQWLVRKDMDVNEHERLFNFTLRYGCKWTWETIQHYT